MIEPYMVNALLVGAIVSVVAGVTGFFVVLRGSSFAAHALSQIGFAGAAGAVLLGVAPIFGLVTFALGGAVAMGALGRNRRNADAIIALVMTASLGLGALFLAMNDTYATSAFALLFGSIVGVSHIQVIQTAVLGAVVLSLLALVYRPLLFSSISEESALARGVHPTRLNVLLLCAIAIAAAVTIPSVGTLLVFALMIAPPAAAILITRTPASAIAIAVLLNLVCCIGGMLVAYASGLPVGFCIAIIAAAVYVAARVSTVRRSGERRRVFEGSL